MWIQKRTYKDTMTKIIAEIGINHNGSINIAKDLIDLSKVAGCDYVKDSVIITTNDGRVIDQSVGYQVLLRNEELSGDEVSTKDVLTNVIQQYNIPDEEIIMMLYLTYPERTWTDIEAALSFFIDNKAKSLLCRVKPKAILIFACSARTITKASKL